MSTAEEVRALLDYNPETGVLTWRERPVTRPHDKAWNTRFAGKTTGCAVTYPSGPTYLQVCVCGTLYLAHRLIWLMVHGEWPKADIDHKDGDGTNNRLANLRAAERFENNQNVKVSSRNTSGFPGVSLCSRSGRWRAQISLKGKVRSLGHFDTREEAGAVYREAKGRLHAFSPEVRS